MMKNSLTVLAVCLSICCVAWQPATADVVFQIENGGTFDITPGSAGTFNVWLTVPNGTVLVGQQTVIDVSPTTGFNFTSFVPVTTFGGFQSSTGSATRAQISDISPIQGSELEISGSVVLFEVNYAVAASVTPGSTFSLDFDTGPTFLLPTSGDPTELAPYTYNNATARAIPEPSAFFCLAAIGLIVGTGRFSKFLASRLSLRG